MDSKAKCIVHRGADAEPVAPSEQPCASSESWEQDFGAPAVSPVSPCVDDEPTHHELQSKADVRGWEQLRDKFLSVATECSAMPLEQLCVLCQSTAEFRCQDCGSNAFYCEICFCSSHENMHFFHVAEKWEVSMYITCTQLTLIMGRFGTLDPYIRGHIGTLDPYIHGHYTIGTLGPYIRGHIGTLDPYIHGHIGTLDPYIHGHYTIGTLGPYIRGRIGTLGPYIRGRIGTLGPYIRGRIGTLGPYIRGHIGTLGPYIVGSINS